MVVKTSSTPLVLVADDTVATTMMLQRVFEFEGYRVECVHDGVTALDAARRLLPDLILLDINMPGMNGFDVLKTLREDPLTEGIPTILITAMGDLSDIVQGLQLGADDYVRKPFHWRELLARAQSKMRARKLEEALQRRTKELEALLRVSEELNQHLELDEILDLILRLTLDLLGGDGVIIYEIDEQGQIRDTHSRFNVSGISLHEINHTAIVHYGRQSDRSVVWDEDHSFVEGFNFGIITPLYHTEQNQLQMILVVLSQTAYDDNHLQLVHGISRQSSMAIRNAELYRVKANYAIHLEDMVEERTHELRSAQQMLIRSEKLASIGRLAASIAHEINNPLLPIQINLDDMLEDLNHHKQIASEEILRTQESVERIRRIVNRLLEFTGNSHIASSTGRPLDLNKLIQNVCELIRKSFEHQGQKIILNLGDVPTINGDKDGLEQVFMNLALNASEAMQRNGTLKISTFVQNGFVISQVEDNGSGIAIDVIDKIFEPFISTKEDGNGLGLFVSYGIIQNHKGTIEVQSQVGTGTVFTVRLPLASATATDTGMMPAVKVSSKRRERTKNGKVETRS